MHEGNSTVCTCLHRLLPKLRANYAELLRRIDIEEESPKRVAEDLKISQSNLTVRLHRARQALRRTRFIPRLVASVNRSLLIEDIFRSAVGRVREGVPVARALFVVAGIVWMQMRRDVRAGAPGIRAAA